MNIEASDALEAAAQAWESTGHADAEFQRAIELAPASSLPRLAYAYYLWATGSPNAEHHALQATHLDDPVGAWRVVGELRVSRGDTHRAIEAYERAFACSNDIDDALTVGTLLAEAGYTSASEAWFQQASEIAPDRAEGWLHLGLHRRIVGDLSGALDALENSVRLAPDHAPAWTELGAILLELDDLEAALDALNIALKLDRKAPWAYVYRALTYWRMERPRRAERDFKRALRWYPDAPEFHSWYGMFLESVGDERRAAVAFERARTLNADDIVATLQLESKR